MNSLAPFVPSSAAATGVIIVVLIVNVVTAVIALGVRLVDIEGFFFFGLFNNFHYC